MKFLCFLLLLCSLVSAQVLTIHYRNSENWTTSLAHWGYRTYEAVTNKAASGNDVYGPYFQITWTSEATFLTTCFTNGSGRWDGVDRRINKPASFPAEVWIKNGDATVYLQNPVDVTPPEVSLLQPADGANCTGKIIISAQATDNQAIAKVEFYQNSKKIGEDIAAPYQIEWDTAYIANGTYNLTAKAFDATGNNAVSKSRKISTNNPNLAPVAKAGGQLFGLVGVPMQFDGSNSYDPNGTIVEYIWTNGLGGSMTGVRPQYTYTKEGTYTVTLTVRDNEGATHKDTAQLKIGKALPRTDFRQETIYFLITTRFFDGDSANNYRSPDPGNKNPEWDPEWRGDFKGLIEKLDYIKALGFTAIWITPVIENKSGYDFHGYHGYDFHKIDPRLESSGYTFQRLIQEVHARNMKIVVDVVFNHSGNWGSKGLFEPVNNSSLPPQQQYLDRVNQLFKSGYYHEGWLSSWESYDEQSKSIAGDCMDFDTEDEKTRQYIISAYNKMIDMGVDGFRVDTVKHISRYVFNKDFIPAFKQRGGDNFYIFGEVCTRVRSIWNRDIPAISAPFYTWKESKDYSNLPDSEAVYQNWLDNRSNPESQPQIDNHYLRGNDYHAPDYSKRSGLDVIDFPMHWNFENAPTAFAMKHGDSCYNDPTWNVVYVDSHDYGPDSNKRYNNGTNAWAENFSMMFTFRGVPCVYYGSEIEFMAGAPCDEGMNAPLLSTGRAYFGDHIEGSIEVSDFGLYTNASGAIATTLEKPLAKHLAHLNRIRRAIPALQKGQYSTNDMTGYMAFKRRYTVGNTDSFVLVTLSGDATFNNIPNGKYVDAVTGDVQVISNGSLTARCSGQGNLRAYVLDTANTPAPGKIIGNSPFIR